MFLHHLQPSSKHTCSNLWQICLTSEAWTPLPTCLISVWGSFGPIQAGFGDYQHPHPDTFSPIFSKSFKHQKPREPIFLRLDYSLGLVFSMSTVLLARFKQDFGTIPDLQVSRGGKLGHSYRLNLGFTTISTTQCLWPTHIEVVPIFSKLLKPIPPLSLKTGPSHTRGCFGPTQARLWGYSEPPCLKGKDSN